MIFVALHIPLILGVKVLHTHMLHSLGQCFWIAPICAIAIIHSIISAFLLEPVRQIDKLFAIALISLTLSRCKHSLKLTISLYESSFPQRSTFSISTSSPSSSIVT